MLLVALKLVGIGLSIRLSIYGSVAEVLEDINSIGELSRQDIAMRLRYTLLVLVVFSRRLLVAIVRLVDRKLLSSS